MSSWAVAGVVFAPQLVGLFSSDPAVLAYGETALRLQCVSFPLVAWFAMCTMLTQTMGRVVSASFLSLARQGLFFIPAVLLMAAMVLVTSMYTLFCHAVLGTHISFNDELEAVMERFM